MYTKTYMERRDKILLEAFSTKLGLRESLDIYDRLATISNQLTSIAERVCSLDMTERQAKWNETREVNLKREAQELCKQAGGVFYHQGDPRGAALYFVPFKALKRSCDYRGIPVPTNEEILRQYLSRRYNIIGYPIY